MIHKDNPSSKNIIKGKETGIRQENVDLSNQHRKDNKAESKMHLPHERDETTEPIGTNSSANKSSREVIKKAYDDTKNGLKDTDRRGIPSDIVESDIPDKKNKMGT